MESDPVQESKKMMIINGENRSQFLGSRKERKADDGSSEFGEKIGSSSVPVGLKGDAV